MSALDLASLGSVAVEAAAAIAAIGSRDEAPDGFMLGRFRNVQNDFTGQSAVVVLDETTGVIFKEGHSYTRFDASLSGKVIGNVEMIGRFFTIRLSHFHLFGDDAVVAMEFVTGESCGCDSAWCEHANAVRVASGVADAHTGNWLIKGDEIIIFDFESLGC